MAPANYLNPQTLNRYPYALNNPNRYTDPTGATLTYGGEYAVRDLVKAHQEWLNSLKDTRQYEIRQSILQRMSEATQGTVDLVPIKTPHGAQAGESEWGGMGQGTSSSDTGTFGTGTASPKDIRGAVRDWRSGMTNPGLTDTNPSARDPSNTSGGVIETASYLLEGFVESIFGLLGMSQWWTGTAEPTGIPGPIPGLGCTAMSNPPSGPPCNGPAYA
jgi:hypothetical protein